MKDDLDVIFADERAEAFEYQGKKVTLNKPRRIGKGDPGYGKKKFFVYVKNDRGNVVRVMFGDPNLEIKRDNPNRRKNFRSRHSCDNPGPKWKARYWSCKMWEAKKSVTQYTNSDIFNLFVRAIKNEPQSILERCDKGALRRYVPMAIEYYYGCIGEDNVDETIHLTATEMQEIVCRIILYVQSRNFTMHENYLLDYLKRICILTGRGWDKQRIINWSREAFRFGDPEDQQLDVM